MENRLRLLFSLQLVDAGLAELEELKGDLPATVKTLQESLGERRTTQSELESLIKQATVSRDETDVEIMTIKERLEKYKTQQFQVKTNKQYDALAREIDQSQDRITKLGKELEALEGKAAIAAKDAEQLKPEIDELEAELAERQKELNAVTKEHEAEELKLRHEREKHVAKLSKSDYQLYERIRKAKDGRAVVPVKRSSCGGCFNRVPPQKILELRKNDALITCERCGRILVSDEIVETATNAR